jgi:hypothetical protein
MRQGAGQANPDPDPLSPESPSPPRRRRGRRRWLVWLFVGLVPLAVGVFGWFDPTDAWRGVWVVPVVIVVTTAQAWKRGGIPQWARPRVLAFAIGYGVLCSAAAPLGAWLAR